MPNVLTINGGSSSIRFAIFEVGRPPRRPLQGKMERVGGDAASLTIDDSIDRAPTQLDRETSDPRAAEALDLFCYQARKWIGSFAAALGGLDTLVFAGGIGENAVRVIRTDEESVIATLSIRLLGLEPI